VAFSIGSNHFGKFRSQPIKWLFFFARLLPSLHGIAMGRRERATTVEQGVYPVPDIPIKDMLGAIPYVAATLLFA
jgi:hypothetical protein